MACPSICSSNTISNLFVSRALSAKQFVFCTRLIGGGNNGSKPIRKAFYTIPGMMRPNNGHDSSKHGLVLISMSHGWKSSSIIKSMPKISKLCYRLSLSIDKNDAFIASVAIFYINHYCTFIIG
jgi:hypothetical protein